MRLLHASFRLRLATTPLRFAITSPPSGCEEDFHLPSVEHARHTKKGGLTRPAWTRRVAREGDETFYVALRRWLDQAACRILLRTLSRVSSSMDVRLCCSRPCCSALRSTSSGLEPLASQEHPVKPASAQRNE